MTIHSAEIDADDFSPPKGMSAGDFSVAVADQSAAPLPKITLYSGKQDPAVVSDGDNRLFDKYLNATRVHSLFGSREIEINSKSLDWSISPPFQADKESEDETSFAFNIMKHCAAMDSKAISNWMFLGFLSDLPKAQRSFLHIGRKFSASNFAAAIDDVLTNQNFEQQEIYEDTLGNEIIDYSRDMERIMLVISNDKVQYLTYLNDKFSSDTFDLDNNTPIQILIHTDLLFA